MAGFVSAGAGSGNLLGLSAIFEFTNQDGCLVRTNCGQAAAATFLTHHGKFPRATEQARRIMAALEAGHPPDELGGLLGTSRRRVTRICRAFGLALREIRGEAALVRALSQNRPVLVMLGVCGGKFLGHELPGGHWMVAYACDQDNVFLTNWGAMAWADFRRGWNAFVPRLIQMRNCGLVADELGS
jgi:hypothetical protein